MVECRYLLAMVLLLSPAVGFAQTSVEQEVQDLFNKGYATLQTDPAGAIPIFEEIVRLDSANLLAQRQLGSLYLGAGRTEEALDRFLATYRIHPSDATGLQIAFLLNSLGRNKEAYKMFRSLRKSEDPDIRNIAEPSTTILALMLCADRFPWWAKIQAYPLYDSRFDNFIFPISLYAGQYTDSSRIASVFGVLSVTQDTRTEGGTLPIIFSDNVAIAAFGLRLVPLRGLTTDVQFGVAVGLTERPNWEKVRWDFRAVASYGNGIFPDIRMPNRVTVRPAFLADVYSSFGYYSRYSNGIGYLQTKAGFRLLQYKYSAFDAYVRIDAAFDTRGDFYNNIVEGSLGFRLIPNHWWGASLALQLTRGVYWQQDQSVNPYDKYYNTIRVFLTFDRFLCW
jgi:tetratricopeptide (TPR) repeat protein